MNIGIVGSGIGGLSAAWLLRGQGHEVVLFERQAGIGLHDLSCVYSSAEGRFSIDVPSRLLNASLWPRLWELFQTIGVETTPVDSSQVFATPDTTGYFQYSLSHLRRLLPQVLLNARARRIVADIRRLRKQGRRDLAGGLDSELTFGQYLDRGGYSHEFRYGFLYPVLSSTVCTCSFGAIENYPARILLETLSKLTHGANAKRPILLRSKHGTADIARRLLEDGTSVSTGTEIESIARDGNHVELTIRTDGGANTSRRRFDHVILAVQANHAERLLAQPDRQELEMLQCFPYENVTVAVHTDPALMPANQRSWSTFNFVLDGQPEISRNAMCTIWLNRFYDRQGLPENLFQTINPLSPPIDSRVLLHRQLQRPVVGPDSFRGWRLLDEINQQPDRRIWFVGSYASYGVPLLETALQSATHVVQAIGRRTEVSDSGFAVCG